MVSVLAAAKPSRKNTARAPDSIWSRFALARGPSSSVFATNEPSCLSKLNSTVHYELAREVCQGGLGLHTPSQTPGSVVRLVSRRKSTGRCSVRTALRRRRAVAKCHQRVPSGRGTFRLVEIHLHQERYCWRIHQAAAG